MKGGMNGVWLIACCLTEGRRLLAFLFTSKRASLLLSILIIQRCISLKCVLSQDNENYIICHITRDFPFKFAARPFSSVIALGDNDMLMSLAIKSSERLAGRPERPCPRLRHTELLSGAPSRAPEHRKSQYFLFYHPTTQLVLVYD